MSGKPVGYEDHPLTPSTASHAPPDKPDPTTTEPHKKINPNTTTLLNAFTPGEPSQDGTTAQGGESGASSASTSELTGLKTRLRKALRQFPDFPSPGVLFEDIMPIFANPVLHNDLIKALELQVLQTFGKSKTPDVIVGLESRGFVRKQGKLPGSTETEAFEKEYGKDYFQIQSDAIQKGQTVLVVDDIMATGGSAAAAGNLVKKCGGELVGFVFLMELEFLKGRDKLSAPVYTLLTGQESKNEAKGEANLPLGQTKESGDEVKSVQDAGGAAADTKP
ncbi:adenine phosphoribosyltransferase [Taxawa tesnikishii (nom. ined.)]|nr:adenine phosphoribosyltransferase [Dothideales sp. JES 119]